MTRYSGIFLACGILSTCGCFENTEVFRPEKINLRIELHTDTPTIDSGKNPKLTAQLFNDGTEPITVVLPGDGSLHGWRTPIVRWNPPIRDSVIRDCGNVNSLKANEVVTLNPGASHHLDWIYWPDLPNPGVHQISLELENVPDLKWCGIPLGGHDSTTMKRVRRTAPFKAVSKVIEIQVREAATDPKLDAARKHEAP